MARKSSYTPPPSTPPRVGPEQGIQLLQRLIEKAKDLLQSRPIGSAKEDAWEVVARDYLVRTFGSDSPNTDSVLDVGKFGSFPRNAGEQYWENHRVKTLETRVTILQSLIETLQTAVELNQPDHLVTPQSLGEGVFLVHGHNEAILHEVARFLEKLELKLTVLREQPNSGRTIIEKFVDYSDVGFAVVLLTGDDRGGAADCAYENQFLRARQNVILELGFFLGKLGRSRVCALYQEGVEIPSDYKGVLFTVLDESGAWRLTLARELRAAGFNVDMNRAL